MAGRWVNNLIYTKIDVDIPLADGVYDLRVSETKPTGGSSPSLHIYLGHTVERGLYHALRMTIGPEPQAFTNAAILLDIAGKFLADAEHTTGWQRYDTLGKFND